MSEKMKRLCVIESSALNSTAEASAVLTDILGEFASLNKSVDDRLKGICDRLLCGVFEGKGKAEGSAFALNAVNTAPQWAIRRFTPAIRRYLVKAGLVFEGLKMKSLRAPESSGLTADSTVDEYRAYLSSLSFAGEDTPQKSDKQKSDEEKAKAEKVKADWTGKDADKLFAQYIINAADRLKEKNENFANELRLMAFNLYAWRRTTETMAKGGELLRELPDELKIVKTKGKKK